MAVSMGELTRFLIEQDGMTFDITGHVSGYEMTSCFDGMIEVNFTVIGDGVQLLMDAPEVKTKKVPEPVLNVEHIPQIRRCGYCRQLNDKDQLYCGHCGGEL